MNILLTGSLGYIGSRLGPYLLALGHKVIGIDTGFYATSPFYSYPNPTPALVSKDIRNLRARDLDGFDAVIHLAGLCNDPTGQLRPEATRQINYYGSLRTAIAARDAGVSRFINFSSCSVYGASTQPICNELSAPTPLTDYAKCKYLAELALTRLATSTFFVVSMRNATVFGPSPQMRFDLVLNNLAGLAYSIGEVRLASDGTPWRPMIHVCDLVRATAMLLDAPANLVNGEVFNVGDDRSNHQIGDIAHEVCQTFPNSKLTIGQNSQDERSYRVSFAKIRDRLGFACEYDIQYGAKELRELFERLDLTAATLASPSFSRVNQLRSLISSGAVDEGLHWRSLPVIDESGIAACTVAA